MQHPYSRVVDHGIIDNDHVLTNADAEGGGQSNLADLLHRALIFDFIRAVHFEVFAGRVTKILFGSLAR